MSNDKMREAFESRFPVPDCMEWAPKYSKYVSKEYGIAAANSAASQNKMLEAWRAALTQQLESEPVEIWLGTGDKLVSDIWDDCDGEWAGVGVFPGTPESEIGKRQPEFDGQPVSEMNPIALIKSTRPESLLVVIQECTEAYEKLTGGRWPQLTPQVPESEAQAFCDWLYRAGYVTREKEKDYDPRGHAAWQACYNAITAAPSIAEERESAQHQWDDSGERCLRCGDKDWFASQNCEGRPESDSEPVAHFPSQRKPLESGISNSTKLKVQPTPQIPDDWREAVQEFVDRCERREIRSKRTYEKFKALLEAGDV